jgi:hypothetical protein
MYMKSVCFSAFILHISGTDRCKIGVRYLIFRPVSTEVEIICINKALQSLKTVNLFLLQQKNAGEQIKLAGKIEKFIKKEQINSMQQTTIDQYFR